MLTKGIADRYAKALLELAPAIEELNLYNGQLDGLIAMDAKDPSLVRFLAHPKVEKPKKKELVMKVLAPHLSKHVLSLILLLIDKNRGYLLIEVAKRFSQIADEVRGVQNGIVISAIPMPDDLFQRLEKRVQKFSEQNIVLERRIDPELIGGVIVKLGNHIFDGSVHTRLLHFRDEMKRVNVATG